MSSLPETVLKENWLRNALFLGSVSLADKGPWTARLVLHSCRLCQFDVVQYACHHIVQPSKVFNKVEAVVHPFGNQAPPPPLASTAKDWGYAAWALLTCGAFPEWHFGTDAVGGLAEPAGLRLREPVGPDAVGRFAEPAGSRLRVPAGPDAVTTFAEPAGSRLRGPVGADAVGSFAEPARSG